MKPTDNIGNPLEIGDLVLFADDQKNVLLCIVQAIKEPSVLAAASKNPMDLVGTVVMMPMPITLPYTDGKIRIMQVTKAVKPTGFAKQQA